jgi:transposase, IS5 family
MYKSRDYKTPYLFAELFPFGGRLDENNRWMKIGKLLPWEEMEKKYATYFSDRGRPAKESRLVVGLFLLKHLSAMSDAQLGLELLENPYWQSFCGLESFATVETINPSTLSRMRKRLGAKYVRELEELTYGVLIERKVLRAKGILCDGTVIPENIKYPNDVGLLNDVREWLVSNIKRIGKEVGRRYRTYCRKGREAYLGFAKSKRKAKKQIRRAKRQMLQYVRRNLKQLKEVFEQTKRWGSKQVYLVADRLRVAEEIFRQQLEMYREKTHRIQDRIVSFHRPWVRPMKRGKNGNDVEFGAKTAMSHVDGFLFLDKTDHHNFSEASAAVVYKQVENYERRFGKKPPSFTADRAYGSLGNRKLLEDEMKIRTSFVSLGKKRSISDNRSRWFKRKQKERNRIEGHFGHGKEHYQLDRVLYHGEEGSEIWTRGGILAMNLMTAMARM